MHRLPNIASSLSSKLGGPKAPTPDRRSLSSLASASKTASRPGDPATRQVQLDQRRKIARVASETLGGQRHNQRPGIGSRNGSGSGIKDNNNNNNGPKRIATLSRSATDTIVPVLKREAESEGNELSLASIPASRRRVGARDSVPSRSHALSQCQRLSQREVDFDAMTKSRSNLAAAAGSGGGNAATSAKNGSNDGGRTTEDARRLQKNKRMEFVDVQLQEAISAIKKPDRRAAVGKEFEKEVERRGGLKVKGKATVRNGPGKGMSYNLSLHSTCSLALVKSITDVLNSILKRPRKASITAIIYSTANRPSHGDTKAPSTVSDNNDASSMFLWRGPE